MRFHQLLSGRSQAMVMREADLIVALGAIVVRELYGAVMPTSEVRRAMPERTPTGVL